MKKKLVISLIFNILLLPFLLIVFIYLFSSIFDFAVLKISSVRMCNTFSEKFKVEGMEEFCEKVAYSNFGHNSLPDIMPTLINFRPIGQFFGFDQPQKEVKGITVDTFNPFPPLQLIFNGFASQIECKDSEDVFKPIDSEELAEYANVIYTVPEDIEQLGEVLDEPKFIVFLPDSAADDTLYVLIDQAGSAEYLNISVVFAKFDEDTDTAELQHAFDSARKAREQVNNRLGTNIAAGKTVGALAVGVLPQKVDCDDGDFYIITMFSPLIYLYPTETEVVSVKINSPIVSSKIKLRNSNYWNVIAHPDGSLTTEDGKKHSFIPYEFLRYDFKKPVKGFVVNREKLEEYLKSNFWPKLGLTKQEIEDYWQDTKPRVKPSPYYFVSLIDKSEIERVLPMEVSPKPDTIIRNMTYILPLSKPFTPKPLDPEKLTAPKREGFTVLENGVFVDGF